jgi:hypothetical protein
MSLTVILPVLCPPPARARTGAGGEALTKGQSYTLPPVPYCVGDKPLRDLVDLRQAGDLDSLPPGCFAPSATTFSEQFKSFIPDYKLIGIVVPEKLARPNRSGRYTCKNPGTGASVACIVWTIRSGFIAGTFIKSDASKFKAFIQVAYGIEVVDPRSSDLQFAPFVGKPPASAR